MMVRMALMDLYKEHLAIKAIKIIFVRNARLAITKIIHQAIHAVYV